MNATMKWFGVLFIRLEQLKLCFFRFGSKSFWAVRNKWTTIRLLLSLYPFS